MAFLEKDPVKRWLEPGSSPSTVKRVVSVGTGLGRFDLREPHEVPDQAELLEPG